MSDGPPTLLVINAGSSSVKYRLFTADDALTVIASGKVTGIGSAPVFEGRSLPSTMTQEEAVELILTTLDIDNVQAVAHRVVHGGPRYTVPALVTDALMTELAEFIPFAPLHQPHNLNVISILKKLLPDTPQYACFDTAFHHGHNPLYDTYALPADLRARGLRRYGFHGLSYHWIATVLQNDYPDLAAGRVVAAHLGNGASLCAMRNGKSVDSTMGLTALEGLPMGTRSGSVDPGLILYLSKYLEMSAHSIVDLLYNQSGLLGLSGISNDVKMLLESSDPRAKWAIDFFSFKAAQHVAQMAVSLGGLDTLVFTGGIGENAAPVRDAILKHLSFLPPFTHLVIPANEEKLMAQEIFGRLL